MKNPYITEILHIINSYYTLIRHDNYIIDQWKRASLSSVLNLSEGVGRMSKADKKHFITISRVSIFECVSILQIIYDLKLINEELYNKLYSDYEKASKMLLGLFRSIE